MADSAEQRDLAQSFVRAKELQLDPIKGNFDQAHLQAVHRHIFRISRTTNRANFGNPPPATSNIVGLKKALPAMSCLMPFAAPLTGN